MNPPNKRPCEGIGKHGIHNYNNHYTCIECSRWFTSENGIAPEHHLIKISSMPVTPSPKPILKRMFPHEIY